MPGGAVEHAGYFVLAVIATLFAQLERSGMSQSWAYDGDEEKVGVG